MAFRPLPVTGQDLIIYRIEWYHGRAIQVRSVVFVALQVNARELSSCGILDLTINHLPFNVASVSFEIYVNIDSEKRNTILINIWVNGVLSREIKIFPSQERFSHRYDFNMKYSPYVKYYIRQQRALIFLAFINTPPFWKLSYAAYHVY